MNLLVTGGAGFIGSNLIHHVIDRPEIRLLVNLDCLTYAGHLENLERVAQHPKYVFVKTDLRDKAAVLALVEKHRITHVLHLAAESHVDRSITGPGDFIQTNVVGTFNLLEACRGFWLNPPSFAGPTEGRQSEIRNPQLECRFHHVSTDEVYGSLGVTGYFTETTPYAPNSPYSASKAASDHLVRAWRHTYGLPVTLTNCSNNYGPYHFPEKLIPLTIANALEGKPLPVYGRGENVRDWLFVDDHVEALLEVVARGEVGESYNIGGRCERRNIDVVEAICDLVDELAPARRSSSRRALITFVADRPGHDLRYAIDPSKIENRLGWRPRHSFEAGLRETVCWYLDNQQWWREIRSGADRRKRLGTPA